MKLYAMPCTGCGQSLPVPFDVAMRIALERSIVMCDRCAHAYEGDDQGDDDECPICVAFGIHAGQVG